MGAHKKLQVSTFLDTIWLALYPLVYAIYPILFTYSRNMEEVRLRDCVMITKLALASMLLLFVVTRIICKSSVKARVAACAVYIVFFTYGPAVKLAGRITGSGFDPRNVMLVVWSSIIILLIVLVTRIKRNLLTTERFMAALIAILAIMSLVQVAENVRQSSSSGRIKWNKAVGKWCSKASGLTVPANTKKPDVYYIILDGYSRSDALLSYYGYDNTPLLNLLKRKGFYVADKSQSNYCTTNSSIASSLNMDYLDKLTAQADLHPNISIRSCNSMLQNSRVVSLFQKAGYTIVTTQPKYPGIEFSDPDVLLGRPSGLASHVNASILKKTMVEPCLDGWRKSYAVHKLDDLAAAPSIPGPKFVFAHIMVSHKPFIFPPYAKPLHPTNGPKEIKEIERVRLYTGAVDHLNSKLVPIIESILSKSATPPIIIVQADHADLRNGPIMNAYYFPNGKPKQMYSSVTPVNSFRIVFNTYFGGAYPLLPDVTYSQQLSKEWVFTFSKMR